MTLALRHPLSSSIVLLALLATLASLTVARPRFQPPVREETVDLGSGPHFTADDVRAAFALHGQRLGYWSSGDSSTWLGADPGFRESGLYAIVFPATGILGLGNGDWEEGVYERRVGNVLVHYGGSDRAMLAAVEDAVASLARYRPVPRP